MRVLRFIPFLVIPVLIYAALAITSGSQMAERMSGQVFALTMASGDVWRMSFGSLFIGLSVLCLFFEVLRSVRPSNAAIGENISTAFVLIVCIALFLLARGFATSEFFLIVLLLLIDFLTDSTVMVFTAKRSVGLGVTGVPH